MEFRYAIFTPTMEEPDFFAEVNKVIQLLKKHNVSTVALMYGWSWGEWEWISPVMVNDIMTEIHQQEIQSHQYFGDNDVYVSIPEYDMEVLFCHEADLHLEFNSSNPLALEILNSWIDSGIVHAIRSKEKDTIDLDELMTSL